MRGPDPADSGLACPGDVSVHKGAAEAVPGAPPAPPDELGDLGTGPAERGRRVPMWRSIPAALAGWAAVASVVARDDGA